MRKVFFLIFVLVPLQLHSAMTGGDFEIYADTIGVLDAQQSTGGDFTLYDTSGEFFATTTQGGTLTLLGGFQAIEKTDVSLSLSTSSLSLGTLSLTTVGEASLVLTAGTTNSSGYSVRVSENGNLCSPSVATCTNDIDDVSDGAVTAGSEEYGIQINNSGSDLAIVDNLLVASSTVSVGSEQTTTTFRASVGQTSLQGSYTHQVTFTATVNP